MTDRSEGSTTGSTHGDGDAEGASVASSAAPVPTPPVRSSRDRAARAARVEELQARSGGGMACALVIADRLAKVMSQRWDAANDHSPAIEAVSVELAVEMSRHGRSSPRAQELMETKRQRILRQEEDTLLAVEATRLHTGSFDEVGKQGALLRKRKQAAARELEARRAASRRSAEANAAAWQAIAERHPEAAYLALLHTLPVDAWRATPKTPMPQVTVTVTPMPIRMGWVTRESVADAMARGVTAKRPARFNFLSREASAAVVSAPHELSTEACAKAASHNDGGVNSDAGCGSSPHTPDSELGLASGLKWRTESERLEEGLKKLELENAALRRVVEAEIAEQAEYDRQEAVRMEWRRQEDAAVAAASEKKRVAIARERARLEQERARATRMAGAHGSLKGGVASGGSDDGVDGVQWQV